MTLSKIIEKSWIGNDLFELIRYTTFNNKKYARFIASVSRPEVKILIFDIPRSALSFLPKNSNPTGNTFLPNSPLAGYQIIQRNNKLQRVYLFNELIYDRIKHGF